MTVVGAFGLFEFYLIVLCDVAARGLDIVDDFMPRRVRGFRRQTFQIEQLLHIFSDLASCEKRGLLGER